MNLPNIYAETPTELVTAETIVTFPVNTFLENIAVSADGMLYITSHEAGQILCMSPQGDYTIYTQTAGKVTGIALINDQKLLTNGWTDQGVPFVAIVENGQVSHLQTVPTAMFFNGITPFRDGLFLMADSYRGAIWQFNANTLEMSIWLEHPLLGRWSDENPFPGVNGLKFYGEMLYASNTQRQIIVRIPVQKDLPHTPEVWMENQNIDDFAFDSLGNFYGSTHVYHCVVKITPNKEATIIAQLEQGLAGCTAMAFGRTEGDRHKLYVVTNGGMTLPPPSGVEPAKAVRLEIGIGGAPLGIGN